MKYELNGISTPIGGISWIKNTSAEDRFRYLLFYFETKRILINPEYMERKEECIQSVLELKSQLIEATKDVSFSTADMNHIRRLVKACDEYLDSVRIETIPPLIYKDNGRWTDASFDSAMKKLRSVFRKEISEIVQTYSLEFAGIIPEEF